MDLQCPLLKKLSLNCPQPAAFEHRELMPATSLGWSSAKQGEFSTQRREGVGIRLHEFSPADLSIARLLRSQVPLIWKQ